MIGVLVKDQAQVPLASDHHPVQALAARTGDPAFCDRVRSWRLHPRTRPSQFIEADKVAAKGLDDGGHDWLILTLKTAPRPLPALPLRLRAQPVQVGEEVYLVGCPYAEEQCKQNVYNVSELTRAEANRLLRARACVRIYRRPDNTVVTAGTLPDATA